ncbi:MAG: histidine kinase [Christensenellaceae bacterium]|jgi:two-component system sensor histidine kinase YesM|nr:histidine kinase [Christensenellaceae bacterium]
MKRLSQKLAAVSLLAVLMMLAVFLVYAAASQQNARRESEAYARSFAQNLSYSLEEKAAAIRRATSTIAQSGYVLDYFYSGDMSTKLQTAKFINAYVRYVIGNTPDILSISLYSPNALSLTMGSNNMDAVIMGLIRKECPEAFSNEEAFSPFFMGPIKSWSQPGEYYAFVMPVYDTRSPVSMTRAASCFALCDSRALLRRVGREVPPMVRGIRLYAKDELLAQWLPEGAGTGRLESSEQLIPSSGWRLVIESEALAGEIASLSTLSILAVVLLACLLLASTTWILARNLVRPVETLIGRLGSLTQYQYAALEDLRFHNELDIIVETVRNMLRRLDESAQNRLQNEKKLYELQLHAKQSELSALQSQINPHFLYNTLECIRSIGLFYGAAEIVGIAGAMAAIFRYSVKGTRLVRLSEELGIVRQYFTIMEQRFDGRFSLKIDFSDESLPCLIPRMILQPLVENAIYHGLEPRAGKGSLRLLARLHRGQLYLLVQDDGLGFPKRELPTLRQRLFAGASATAAAENGARSLGLANVCERLRLLAPGGSLRVHSIEKRGVTVLLRLPLGAPKPFWFEPAD